MKKNAENQTSGNSQVRLTRREFLKAAAAAGIALSLPPFLPGGTRKVAAASARTRIIVGQGVDLESWDPYGHSSTVGYSIWQHFMEPLMQFDFETRRFRPVLAESWTNENGTDWVFKIRRGVRFTDGSELTAADVVYSLERVINGSRQASTLSDVREVSARDARTVVITTKKPVAPFLHRLSNKVILSSAAAKKFGAEMDKHPVGTGPFRFVEWIRGTRLVAVRNEGYWGSAPKIDEAVWLPIPEDAARMTALETGACDLVTNVPPHEADRLSRVGGIKVISTESLRHMFICLNHRFKPLDNKLVRKAIYHAVDVGSIIKYVLNGRATKLVGPLAKPVFGYDPGLKPYDYNPKKARELLAQAGYPGGFEIDFYTPTGRYVKDREVSQAIVAQLADVGIRAQLKTPEWAMLANMFMDGKLPMVYIGRGGISDPDDYLAQYFQTGGSVRCNYSNPQVDRLLNLQRETMNEDKREEIIRDAVRIIHDDAAMVFLFTYDDIYALDKRVVWNPRPDEYVFVFEAEVRG
ncbi:MAG: ABC transporter substrate-binding protein [Bacillota bacterium]